MTDLALTPLEVLRELMERLDCGCGAIDHSNTLMAEKILAELAEYEMVVVRKAPQFAPIFAAGQTWVPTVGRAKPRRIVNIGPYRGWANDIACIYWALEEDEGDGWPMPPWSWKSWVNKTKAMLAIAP